MPLFGPSGGGVTSVGLTSAGVLYSVSGSPITTSGTLALGLLSQTANTVLAGPTSGGSATPTMRSLVASDLPAHDASLLASGTLPDARLSGNVPLLAAGTLADGVLSSNVPLKNATNVFTTAGSSASSGTASLFQITPTVTQSGTAGYTGILFNVTQTGTGSGTKTLLDLQVGAVSKFLVDNVGNLWPQGDLKIVAGKFVVDNAHSQNYVNWTSSGALALRGQVGLTLESYSGAVLIQTDQNSGSNTLTLQLGQTTNNKITLAPTAGLTLQAANSAGTTLVQHASAAGVPLTVKGAASQTADLLACQDSAAAVQLGLMNSGSGASPVWALRVRRTSDASSLAQSHTIGAATGRAIQVFDDTGSSLGWVALYA